MTTKVFLSHFLVFAIGLTTLFLVSSCDKIPMGTTEQPISELKSKNFSDYIGKEVKVTGYLVFDEDGGAQLISDLKLLEANSLIGETNYIRLEERSVTASLSKSKEELFGAQVEMTATVQESSSDVVKRMTDLLGAPSVVELKFSVLPKIIKPRPQDWQIPSVINICELHPQICQFAGTFLSTHYALLFSGGINSGNAHARYWNDLKYMYMTLKKKGYTDDRIVVIYKDGVAGDAVGDMPVDYAATSTGINDAFAFLKGKMDSNDQLLFFATNHGGGFHQAENVNYSGATDSDGDEIDTYLKDETIFYYNQSGVITDDLMAQKFADLKMGTFIAVLEPCFSGGFLRDLSGNGRVIISAANEFEFSWGRSGGQYDEFSYHFTAALNGQTPEGTTVNADQNGDGSVSMYEAYRYAKTNDGAAEHPKYDDNGDKVGTDYPEIGTTDDGPFGKNVFL